MTRLGPLLSPILIGRDDLLDLADRRLAEAAAGRRQFLLLAGEAGVGKSRLMGAIDSRARGAGFRTAGGFVAPQDQDVPAASFLDMARTMSRSGSWEAAGHALLELVDEAVAAPQPRRRLLVLRVVDLLAAAIDGPVLLAFDDLQWADNLTLEILTELSRTAADRRLLLLGAYRTDELAPGAPLREWRARLLTQRAAEEARLAPLTQAETALMTTLILGRDLPAPRDVVAAVYERTDGVPLHIEELLGALSEDERSDSRAIRDAAVPDTLEEAIVRRVGRLSPEAQAVARSGAVIGRCFVPHVLAAVMDVPADALDGPLRELVDEHVLLAPGVRGLYDFRHQLLRDALYRSLGEAQRRRLHARAAEYGRELEGASEIHASLHFERAGLAAEAFRSAVEAARLAARLSSHREAFELYARAVDNMPAALPPAEQGALFEAYAVEAAAMEELGASEWAAREARTQFLEAGEAVRAAVQLGWLAVAARRRARPLDERKAMLDAAAAELDAAPDGPRSTLARGILSMELAQVAIERLDLPAARAALDAGRAAASRAGDEPTLKQAASLECLVDALSGRLPDALDGIASVARESRERGLDDTGVTAYREAALTAARVLEYGRAAVWIDEGLRYADAIEQSHCAHVMGATSALVAWARGEWDDAVVRGERALADRGCERAAGMAHWPLGYVALGRGQFDVARRELEAARRFAEVSGAPDHLLAAAWGLAELALMDANAAEAVEVTSRSLGLARSRRELGQFAPIVVTGMRARMAAGLLLDAERWLDAAHELYGDVPHYRFVLDHAEGIRELAAGSAGAARPALERAVRGWEARERIWEAAWARLDLAAALIRARRFVDGSGILGGVRETAQRLRSAPMLERVDELGRLGRRRGTEQSAWHPLTAREYEVARLIANGLTNAEIAHELTVAPKTVSAHVEHVLAKLGAARRTEIATWVASTATASPAAPASPPAPDGRARARISAGSRIGSAPGADVFRIG